jgi:hypothetical protein
MSVQEKLHAHMEMTRLQRERDKEKHAIDFMGIVWMSTCVPCNLSTFIFSTQITQAKLGW